MQTTRWEEGGLYGPLHPVNQVTADLAFFFVFFNLFHCSYGVYTSAAVPVFPPYESVGAVLLPQACH